MRFIYFTALCMLLANVCTTAGPAAKTEPAAPPNLPGRWLKLPPLPDREGFAGSFSGVTGGSLVVAGGANFPGRKPWEGGAKTWSDTIFLLGSPGADWRAAGKLPRPLGYGVSVTVPDGVVCIGGSDSQGHSSDVFLIRWTGENLEFQTMPSLPQPCANLSGARLGETIYVAGGIAEPNSSTALKTFWSLDPRNPDSGWRALDPWPGPERMFAVAAVHDGSFYLFSGAALKPGPNGGPVREWLRDAYRYTPGSGWKKLADLPRSAVAAPSPAPAIDGRLLILGGDDGSQVSTLPAAHRGFARDVLAFNPSANEWHQSESLPFGLVTTTTVTWNTLLVIPGGESRPGIRSTEVWARVSH